jgi:sulfite exporter TauE/SafE
MRVTTMIGDPALQRFSAGLAWGLMPCAMVYGGLMTAMLSGSAVGGGVVMFAFGIGTLPGLFAATSGIGALLKFGSQYVGRQVAGLTIAALGFSSVLIVHPAASALCLSAAKRLVQN